MKLIVPSLAAVLLGTAVQATTDGKPNFIFIITDDQDQQLGSIDFMDSVKKHIRNEGTTFSKHFCTVSLCCPSRVSLLTGKAAHNTNVTDVAPPWGGYPKFISQGLNDNYLPIWLQDAGYNTYYTGKLMNNLGVRTYQSPPPSGWNRSDFLLDPNTYVYNNAYFTLDNKKWQAFPGEYSTDLIAKRSLEFLKEGIDTQKPFFIGVAPIAPHSELTDTFREPVPAARHQDLFADAQVPRNKNFNPPQPGTASYFKNLPRLSNSQVQYLDNFHRRRLQSLQAVDDLVDDIFDALRDHPSVLANTYIIYTADNGFHLGQHRLPAGKTCGIEEDVNVPFIIRGPGITKNKTVDYPTSHTDLAPTFLQLAGIPLRDDFDGLPIPVRAVDQTSDSIKTEHVNIEYWGRGIIEGTAFNNLKDYFGQNTYKTLRIVSEEYEFMYTVWCNGDHELYNMKRDPYQTTNLYGTHSQCSPYNIAQLTKRLDTLVLTLKNCKADSCRYPWKAIFPSGEVTNLHDALDGSYDKFFDSQRWVSFDECTLGYIPELEGPAGPRPYQESFLARDAELRDEHWI
ncbi:arylsulfatase precursor [Cordyceps militaris CM01]|uniref:Arylsulfatase n=1 Tax=Cordyceps militaris (strain CM01) TaxID=983644 RepID=G3JPV4_CORMM|nr:arylsulfatase precursor [Cordyceps militaris CM01]EGX89205.1 arylsulfatase precursor [Cordyceps militaris CM01]